MSKKRSRESQGADVSLIEIYEDLAHEDESIRVKAAHTLLTKHVPNADQDQTRAILTRLFRGLCSSRKAARLGFSIALTETLSQLKAKNSTEPTESLSPSQVIQILDKQTKAESGARGQEERDYYFGRAFGSDAIIKSGLVFDKSYVDQWDQLLDIICQIAVKKPWLRQECGWILYQCVQTSLQGKKLQQFAVRILEKLSEHKLVRTPEGLAIWIGVRQSHPQATLPKNVWKYNDPLSPKDLRTLADVLKDAKSSGKNDGDYEVQGSATWASSLHFVWDIVLAELLVEKDDQTVEQETFIQDFWQTAVDQALFAPSNSHERKQWGFSVMQKALERASVGLIRVIFSENAVNCLMQSLKANDRHLQRSAQKVVQTVNKRVAESPVDAGIYMLCLLNAAGMVDFDAITKTKTIDGLVSSCGFEASLGLAVGFTHDLKNIDESDAAEASRRRRLILNYESKIITQQVNQALKDNTAPRQEAIYTILQSWVELAFGKSGLDDQAKKTIREKIQHALEQVLKVGKEGRALVLDVIGDVYQINPPDQIEALSNITSEVVQGWQRFQNLHDVVSSTSQSHSKQPNGFEKSDAQNTEAASGLALLYGLTLFEIHSGDSDAFDILRDLLDYETENTDKHLTHTAMAAKADGLVEILLSFASRPSKFLRRITLIIFESFASQVTRVGLRSLTDILETKETKAGQQELFDAGGDEVGSSEAEDDDNSDVDELDSDVEMLDSDVEVVDAPESSSDEEESDDDTSSSDSNSDSDSESDSNTSTAPADLVALETSLAKALGTRKLTQSDVPSHTSSSDNDSDSDSDMTDSAMLPLDEKLTEIFRHRNSLHSKKKDQKAAKENILNFKNRVLDMLEVYLKSEYLSSRSLEVLVPLLRLARSTAAKQLAERAVGVIRAFCKRCAGMERVPTITSTVTIPTQDANESAVNGASSKPSKSKSKSKHKHKHTEPDAIPTPDPTDPTEPEPEYAPPEVLTLLRTIHAEASLSNTSNAHRAACSAASILLVKVLLKAGVGIDVLVGVYAATRTRMLVDEMCRVHEGFFVDWGNWCGSVRGKLR